MVRLIVNACVVMGMGCGLSPAGAPPRASRALAIVDGEPATDAERAVFALQLQSGIFRGLCTATLVSPRVVLTAKHCVQLSGASDPLPPSAFFVVVGDEVSEPEQTFLVQSVVTTPGVYYAPATGGLTGDLVGQDVALVTLATSAIGLTHYPIRREDPTPLIGAEAKAVGYGITPSGPEGTKLRVMTSVERFDENDVMITPAAICRGDSGGPLFGPDGEVFGVASFGSPECGSGINGWNRLDPFLDMIDQVIGEAGGCLDNGAEVCDGFDNDCNELADEVCSEVGEPCATVDDCIGGENGGALCESTRDGQICTRACDPLAPHLGCPAGMYCEGISGCEGRCVMGSAGTLLYGEACLDDTDCVSLFCADRGDGRRECSTPCRGDEGTCFAGEVCTGGAGECGACTTTGNVEGPFGVGEYCREDADCRFSRCFFEEALGPRAAYCTALCMRDSDCGYAFHCRVRDGEGVCIRGARPGIGAGSMETVGPSCFFNEDCGPGGFCASRAEARWCSSFCTMDQSCPPDFSCVEARGTEVCAPDLAVLGEPCVSDGSCVSRLCMDVGDKERCTTVCDPETPCPTGFECRRGGGAPEEGLCVIAGTARKHKGKGCSMGSSGGSPWTLLIFGTALILVFRRRW